MTKIQNTFSYDVVFNCTFALMLDKRHDADKEGNFPVMVRFTIDRARYYWKIGKQSEDDFNTTCRIDPRRQQHHRLYNTYKSYNDTMEDCRGILRNIGEANITLDRIKYALTNKNDKAESFISIWKDMITSLRNEGRYTTAHIYQRALNNMTYILCNGDTDKEPIKDFCITKSIIQKWINGMNQGVTIGKGKDAKVIGKIGETTKGIYLRHFRAVWNKCKDKGYLRNIEYPFSNDEKKHLISIPVGMGRKERYLNVDKMTELYNIFINRSYPASWSVTMKRNCHYALGLFLFQYLGNGMNLADVAQLEYNDYYFNNEEKCFQFYRQKTKRKAKENSEVIVPITEELQNVIEGISLLNDSRETYKNTPERGQRVFPALLHNLRDAEKVSKRLNQENTNIQSRLKRINRDILHWKVEPSGTWARHSFATNLSHAGVDELYISYSMGHSTKSNDITLLYIAKYPIEKQMEENKKLLALKPETKDSNLQDIINSLSDEQKVLLAKMLQSKSA